MCVEQVYATRRTGSFVGSVAVSIAAAVVGGVRLCCTLRARRHRRNVVALSALNCVCVRLTEDGERLSARRVASL